MKKYKIRINFGRIILVGLALAILFFSTGFNCSSCKKSDIQFQPINTKENNMKLESKNFNNEDFIPSKYTCDGENSSPQLSWSDMPVETKSFALALEDPDAPSGTFTHWLVINIPADTTSIKEGALNISNATAIKNSAGKLEYFGPCPPSGTHRYTFKIFALSIEKLDGITLYNFYEKIDPYILAKGELVGKYSRN